MSDALHPLPRPLRRELERLLHRRWSAQLEPGERFIVQGGREEDWFELNLSLEAPDACDRSEVSVRVELAAVHGAEDEALALSADAAEAVLGRWLEEGRPPPTWADFAEMAYEGHPVHVRHRRRRPALDAEAARLLGASDEEGEA